MLLMQLSEIMIGAARSRPTLPPDELTASGTNCRMIATSLIPKVGLQGCFTALEPGFLDCCSAMMPFPTLVLGKRGNIKNAFPQSSI